MSTLFPAKSETNEPVDWTVTPEFTVRVSVSVVGSSGAAVRVRGPATVLFTSMVSGLWALMNTGPLPLAVAVSGWDGEAKTTPAMAFA